ncbi:hypothetical protein [Gordonia sp. ABSL49_1]|nr:hypothetical protein [Gordonia sp. ABSL49_1]MCH5644152.1 hypothetical protein [Gordonia sp. ABSL49_1]
MTTYNDPEARAIIDAARDSEDDTDREHDRSVVERVFHAEHGLRGTR